MGIVLRLKRRTNKLLRKVGLMERTSRRRVKKHVHASTAEAPSNPPAQSV